MEIKIPKILSRKILDFYKIERNTFIVKNTKEVDNKFELEVGDIKQDDFKPQVKLLRWNNECNASFRLIDNELDISRIETEGNVIKFIKKKLEAHFYDKPKDKQNENGAYEFEVILKEKSARNKIQFSIETKGLEFRYQAELTQQEKEQGMFRPENVIGSYAVYHATKKNHITGQTNYKAGKAFHIYRPKIIDATGKEVWGEFNKDVEETKKLEITIPEGLVYPVRIDPTFGETEKGGTPYSAPGYLIVLEATLTEAGTATKLTTYLTNTDGSNAHNARCGLYDEGVDDKAEDLLQDSGDVSIAASYDDWKDFDITDEVLTAADYWLCQHLSSGLILLWYDSGGREQETSQTYGALPAIFPDVGVNAYTPTIYCTYTVAPPVSPNLTDRNNYNGYLAFIQQYIRHKINGTTPWKNPDGTPIE